MGFAPGLMNGLGSITSTLGAMVGPPADAASAGTASVLYGKAATGLAAGGDVLASVGAYQSATFQSQVAKNNAALLSASARGAELSGDYAEQQKLTETGRLVASEKAAQAANGVDVNVGSAPQVRASTQAEGTMDAATLHYNALRAAYGLDLQSQSQRTMSKVYGQEAGLALVGGGLKASSTLLSGASALSDKWAAFKQTGVKARG